MDGHSRWWRCNKCGFKTRLFEWLNPNEKREKNGLFGECECGEPEGWSGPFDTEAGARGRITTVVNDPLHPNHPVPSRKWWRCKGCGRTGESYQAPDWNNSPFVPSGPVRCSGCCKEEGWHGPFATEQEAKDHGYIKELSEAYVAPPFTHSDYLENVIKRQVADCKAWTFQHESVIDNKSEEDNKMSSAIFCDVCRGSFPIEETSLIVFDAIKKNREGNAIEKQKAYNSHICDTCLGTLMAEPTVAKLPWSKWTKDDDCDG